MRIFKIKNCFILNLLTKMNNTKLSAKATKKVKPAQSL